jgi:PAS domain S-box-containing protein
MAVPIDITNGDAEIRHLRSSINDLISLQTLPAIWDGREPGSIAGTLIEVLVRMLQLDFAYVRLNGSGNESPVELLQLAQRRALPPQALEIGRALDRWLTNESFDVSLAVPHPAGDGEVMIAPFRLGLTDEIGVLVVSSKRAAFPTPTETLLLRTAGNQALVALQEARQLHEQKRAAEELERRVADRTAQLTAANEALRESEKKYRTLFDSIDEGFCTIEVLFDENDNPVDYRFLEVNPSFEKQTGIQNARGRRMREIIPHHEEHWFQIYGRIALTGEPVRFENQAAELHRWYDVYAFRVGEPGDRKVALLFKDITERKQAEAKLLLNEAYLSEAQRLSHTGSFGWKPSSGELLWTEETFRIFQYEKTMKPTVGLVLQRVHPDDADFVKETIERVSQDGKDFDFEHRLLMPDGSTRHLHVVAHAEHDESAGIEFVGAVMDITERKRTEGRIRQIIDTIPAYAWSARPDGTIDFINRPYLEFTGRSVEELLGSGWGSTYHPDDLPRYLAFWRAAMAAGVPMESEVRVRRSDGHYRWLLTRNVPLRDETGDIIKWYGTAIDIEGRKRAEEALRRNESYLAEAQRLSRTGSWAWNVKARENVYWSKEHFRIYGFDPDTASGDFQAARNRIHPDDAPRFDEAVEQAIRGRNDFKTNHRIILPGGAVRYIHTVGHPVFNDVGELVEFIGTTMDVTERKLAEEALRRSENYLAEAQRLSHTGSWAYDILTGKLVHSSEEHRRLFGFDPEKGIPSFDELVRRIHLEDRPHALQELETTTPSGQDFDAYFRIVLPDGTMKYLYGTGHPVFNPAGDVREFVGIVMDVTERKLAEEALRRSESYLAEAQKLSHTGSWARNLATNEITYWSEECHRVLGFDPHDGLPQFKTFLQRVHPSDQAGFMEIAETARREKMEYEVDYRIVHPGGQIRDIHAVGHPVFNPSGDLVEYVGTVIDITEQKRAQVLLAGENRLLEMIARGDSRALILDAICRLVEELVGGSLSSILLLDSKTNQLRHGAAPGLPAAYIQAIDGAIIGPCAGSCGTAAYRAEPVIVSDIATDPLWVNYRDLALAHGLRACWSTPILSSAGKVWGTFAIYYREPRSPTVLDHSVIGRIVHLASIAVEREQSEEALRKAQADLTHVSRVTTMGELVASIAHEVNQPLTAVVNNASASISLLPKNAPNVKEVREALTEIIDDANRASDVITRIRQLAKKAPIEKSLLDLRDVVQDVLALARYESATRQITIGTDLSYDLPSVFGDRVQLQQVLLNLVMNGMDAMNEVKETKRLIIISVKCQTQDEMPMLLLSVQDSGIGFKPKEMDRLFEAFYTTKPNGLGLGLAISHSIIEAHGGRLWAEPNQGSGATFMFSLPTADGVAL